MSRALPAALLLLAGCGGSGGDPQQAPIAYAYVTSTGASPGSAGAVYEYAIMSDFSLSPLAQTSVGAGVNPSALVMSGGHVYVVNVGDGTISQYTIQSDNTLAPMNPASVANPGMHTLAAVGGAAAVDPTGNVLYVANTADASLSQFSIGTDGGLTPLSAATVATGVNPVAIVPAVDSNSGSSVYVVNSGAPNETGSVSQYTTGTGGVLVPTNAAPVPAGTNPTAMVINSPYATAYVLSNCDGSQCLGSIRQFAVAGDGALTDTGTIVTTGSHYRAAGMVLDPNGANGYVLANQIGVDTESGTLWHFQVQSSGALAPANPESLSIGPVAVAQVIDVNMLYVLTTNTGVSANTLATGGSVVAYSIGTGGALAPEATTKITAPNPSGIAIHVLLAP